MLKPFFGAKINHSHPLARGLVYYPLFNDGTGNILNDYSGNRFNEPLNNMDPPNDWGGSPDGGALYFDGANDYVGGGDQFSHLLGTEYTVSLYFKTYNISQTKTIMAYEGAGGALLFLIQHNANRARLVVRDDAALQAQALTPFVIQVGVWHRLDAVRDGNNISIFIDDKVGTPASRTFGVITVDSFTIGAGRVGSAPLNGAVSRGPIWNRALSADERRRFGYNPYAMFERPSPERYFVPLSGIPLAVFINHYKEQGAM